MTVMATICSPLMVQKRTLSIVPFGAGAEQASAVALDRGLRNSLSLRFRMPDKRGPSAGNLHS